MWHMKGCKHCKMMMPWFEQTAARIRSIVKKHR